MICSVSDDFPDTLRLQSALSSFARFSFQRTVSFTWLETVHLENFPFRSLSKSQKRLEDLDDPTIFLMHHAPIFYLILFFTRFIPFS